MCILLCVEILAHSSSHSRPRSTNDEDSDLSSVLSGECPKLLSLIFILQQKPHFRTSKLKIWDALLHCFLLILYFWIKIGNHLTCTSLYHMSSLHNFLFTVDTRHVFNLTMARGQQRRPNLLTKGGSSSKRGQATAQDGSGSMMAPAESEMPQLQEPLHHTSQLLQSTGVESGVSPAWDFSWGY